MIDWTYWANLDVVTYVEACTLSRGFDPRAINGNALPPELAAELRRRESIAKSHLGRGLPSHGTEADRYYGGTTATGVQLSQFRTWAEALPAPFTFPDEFPREPIPEAVAPAAELPAQGKMTPPRERNNLLRVIRALDSMNPKPLPQTGYAESVRAKLTELGLTPPSDDTIRKIIGDARSLDS